MPPAEKKDEDGPADPPVVEPEAAEESPTPEEREETMEQAVQRRTQANMDQSIAMIKQGRFRELGPKVTQLLAAYEQTLKPSEGAGNPTPTAPAADAPVNEGDRSQVETEVVAGMWARDFKALCTELNDYKDLTNEDFATIDVTNTKKFPQTREGYGVWQEAANQLRLKVAATQMLSQASEATQGDREEVAAVDADRIKAAGSKKQPSPPSAGGALTDIGKATQRHKEGKLDGKEYLEIVRKGTGQGVLD